MATRKIRTVAATLAAPNLKEIDIEWALARE